MDFPLPLTSNFYNENINNSNKMHTPEPIKIRLLALLDMMQNENNYLEITFGKDYKEEFSPSFNSLINKRCSLIIGSLKNMKMVNDSDSSYSNSEISSPNKTPSADSIDENMNDIFYDMIPSRASNPHVFDDYFERKNINFNEEDEAKRTSMLLTL